MSHVPGHIWAACSVGWMLIGANGGIKLSWALAGACALVAILSWARAQNAEKKS